MEILPGAIAFFDAKKLNDDINIEVSGDPVTRAGSRNQFLCYERNGKSSCWTPLTSTQRDERIPIKQEWLSNAYGKLGEGEVYLQDGKNIYCGENASFIEASLDEDTFHQGRPIVSPEGVAAVRNEIASRNETL